METQKKKRVYRKKDVQTPEAPKQTEQLARVRLTRNLFLVSGKAMKGEEMNVPQGIAIKWIKRGVAEYV